MRQYPSFLLRLLPAYLLSLATLPLHSQGDGSPVDSRIALFETEFLSEYEQLVERIFKANERELDLKYYQALDRVLDNAVKAARLEEAIAIREEKKRIDEATGVPAVDEPTDPAVLKQVRATYRIEHQKLEAERDLSTRPVVANHDSRLETYQTLLTTEGKLDDALKVKEARGNAAAVLQNRGASKGASPSLPSTTAPTPLGVADQGEGWHEIFNGIDLTSWKPHRTQRSFQIADGVLSARKESKDPDRLYFEGDVAVPELLKNFEMKMTIKADAESNSGIYFHTIGRTDDEKGNPETGLEISLMKGKGVIQYPTGSIHGQGPRRPSQVNQADWFDLRFRVEGQKVTVWINDKFYYEQVAPLAGSSKTRGIQPEGGRIAVQAMSTEGAFHFKSIAVKVLK